MIFIRQFQPVVYADTCMSIFIYTVFEKGTNVLLSRFKAHT